MVTIKQVAHEAGVSVGTVSNVLNEQPGVHPDNKGKVLAAIEKLQYTPNRAARMLKTNRSQSISLIVPDITNPFYAELARGVEDAAVEKNFTVVLCNSDRSEEKERTYIDLMLQNGSDGIIIVKPHLKRLELIELQKRCGVVLVDIHEGMVPDINVVNADDYHGELEAMGHLYNLGHRRIGFLCGQLDGKSDQERLRAYKDAHIAWGLPVEDDLIACGSYSLDHGHSGSHELLSQPNRPTALVCSNDVLAIGAFRAAHDLGLSIPKDISIVGYDDIAMSTACTPQLTTVHRPKYEIGEQSTDMLIRCLTENAEPEHRLLSGHLVVRSSTAKPAISSHHE